MQAIDNEELKQYTALSAQQITIDGKTKSRYQWSQEQRKVETEIRYLKDEANACKAMGDMQGRRETQAKIDALQEYYSKISAESGIGEEKWRMSVSGFSPVKAATTLNNGSKSGIINTGTSTTKARMYDASGNEKYIYPTTDAIQKLDSSKAIADYFTYTDRYGDTKKPITEQFGQFDIEVQKEAAEGIQWAMESYKLDTLPDIITRGKVSSGAVAEYTYSHNLDGSPVHSVTFRPSTKANEAYTTAVHEMTHYVDHTYHDVSRSVCEQARKNLKLRLRTKDYDNLAYRIAESDSDDPAELLAYSMEMHIMKKGNKLSEEIVRLFFERINK